MFSEQQDSFLKIKINNGQDDATVEEKSQNQSQIRIIKQQCNQDQSEGNENIDNLIKATSNLYYAMYQIKDKNLCMIHSIKLDFEKITAFFDLFQTLIQENQESVKNFKQNEQNKYQNANNWTENIIQNYNDFPDLFLQIYQVANQMYKQFKKKLQGHILVLQQNQNPNYNKFLYVFCFIQNLDIAVIQDQDGISNSQLIKVEEVNDDLQEFNHRQSKNIYLNLTSDINQQDIDFWSLYMKDIKEQNLLLVLHPYNSASSDKLGIQNLKLKKNTRREIIFPIIYQDIIQEYQMRMIYKSFLHQQIVNFNPDCIYVEYLLTNEFLIDLKALEYLFRQLQKKAKITVHLRISSKEKFAQDKLSSNLNAIIMGLQGFKNLEQKFLSESEYENIVNWTFKMISLNENQNRNINQSLQEELQQMQIQIQNLKKKFGYFINQQIFHFKDFENFQSQSFQYFVFEKAIILQDKISRDIFYCDLTLIKTNSPDSAIQLQKINLKQILIEPSIIVLQYYLIIAYGHDKNNNFSNQILIYDLRNLSIDPIVMDRNEEFAKFKENCYQKFQNAKQLVDIIRNRRGPQICNNNNFDQNEDQLSFILIGGESKQSDVIMNVIEVVILDLRLKKFCSFIVNNKQLSIFTSLKPWPYQVVLEGYNQQACLYLVLNGNQAKKLNYFSFPKNPSYLKQAQLLVQSQNSFQLFLIPIIQKGQIIIQLDELLDESKCQCFDLSLNNPNCLVWKILVTRFIHFKHQLINNPLFQGFKSILNQLKENQFLQICFQVTVKLILQDGKNTIQNYQSSSVAVDYSIIEIYKDNIQ